MADAIDRHPLVLLLEAKTFSSGIVSLRERRMPATRARMESVRRSGM
jgi:hypothetical protein